MSIQNAATPEPHVVAAAADNASAGLVVQNLTPSPPKGDGFLDPLVVGRQDVSRCVQQSSSLSSHTTMTQKQTSAVSKNMLMSVCMASPCLRPQSGRVALLDVAILRGASASHHLNRLNAQRE